MGALELDANEGKDDAALEGTLGILLFAGFDAGTPKGEDDVILGVGCGNTGNKGFELLSGLVEFIEAGEEVVAVGGVNGLDAGGVAAFVLGLTPIPANGLLLVELSFETSVFLSVFGRELSEDFPASFGCDNGKDGKAVDVGSEKEVGPRGEGAGAVGTEAFAFASCARFASCMRFNASASACCFCHRVDVARLPPAGVGAGDPNEERARTGPSRPVEP